ncbi:MAG: hypothetical protein U9Q73_00280 [Nanoarchaeota archaeon]|nr:hypothetical protein [Nanoarchaeota archaeon]
MVKTKNIRGYLFFTTFGEVCVIVGAIELGIKGSLLIAVLLILIGILFKWIGEESK